MGYELYDKLINLLKDERFSKNLKRKFLREYTNHKLITMQESNTLYAKYVK